MAGEMDYAAAQDRLAQLESDIQSHNVYQIRLENELDAHRELVRSGTAERQDLFDTIERLNETIDNLTRYNVRMEYEKELEEGELRDCEMEKNKKTEEREMSAIHAETMLKAAQMQAANWRKRHDELFDRMTSIEEREKESMESINEPRSSLNEIIEEATKKTLIVQNELTISQMKCVVLEKEKEDLLARMNGPPRTGAAQFVEGRNAVDIEKLMKERDDLAKDKQSLAQRLLDARSSMYEKHRKEMAESKRKEMAEWEDQRSNLYRELKEALEEIYELENEPSNSRKLKELEGELEDLKEDYDKLFHRKNKLAHQLNESRRVVESTKEEFVSLQSEKKLVDAEIRKMREANGRQNSTVVRELADVRLRMEEMERSARLSTENMSDEKEMLSARIEEMTSKIEELTREKTELFGNVEKSESDSAMFRERCDQMQKKMKEEERSKESESAIHLERCEDLERKLDSARLMIAGLQSEKTLVDEEIEKMREAYDSLQNQKHFEFDVLQAAFAMLSEQHEIVLEQNTRFAVELADARKRTEEIERMDEATSKRNSLKSELSKNIEVK